MQANIRIFLTLVIFVVAVFSRPSAELMANDTDAEPKESGGQIMFGARSLSEIEEFFEQEVDGFYRSEQLKLGGHNVFVALENWGFGRRILVVYIYIQDSFGSWHLMQWRKTGASEIKISVDENEKKIVGTDKLINEVVFTILYSELVFK